MKTESHIMKGKSVPITENMLLVESSGINFLLTYQAFLALKLTFLNMFLTVIFCKNK